PREPPEGRWRHVIDELERYLDDAARLGSLTSVEAHHHRPNVERSFGSGTRRMSKRSAGSGRFVEQCQRDGLVVVGVWLDMPNSHSMSVGLRHRLCNSSAISVHKCCRPTSARYQRCWETCTR